MPRRRARTPTLPETRLVTRSMRYPARSIHLTDRVIRQRIHPRARTTQSVCSIIRCHFQRILLLISVILFTSHWVTPVIGVPLCAGSVSGQGGASPPLGLGVPA